MAMQWDLCETMDYYRSQGAPRDQQALVNLLRELQQQEGFLPRSCVSVIAEGYGLSENYLLAIIRRFPSLQLQDQHILELCAGSGCGKHTALARFAESLASDRIRVKYTPCLRCCAQGPNLRLDGRLYHHADEALIRKLISKEHGV